MLPNNALVETIMNLFGIMGRLQHYRLEEDVYSLYSEYLLLDYIYSLWLAGYHSVVLVAYLLLIVNWCVISEAFNILYFDGGDRSRTVG